MPASCAGAAAGCSASTGRMKSAVAADVLEGGSSLSRGCVSEISGSAAAVLIALWCGDKARCGAGFQEKAMPGNQLLQQYDAQLGTGMKRGLKGT